MWETSLLGHFNDLAVHLIGLPLHSPVDPIKLDLQTAGGKHRSGVLGPDDEGAQDEE